MDLIQNFSTDLRGENIQLLNQVLNLDFQMDHLQKVVCLTPNLAIKCKKYVIR